MTPKTITVNGRSFTIIKPLGEGGFSFVYLVQDRASKTKYALKSIRIQLPEHESRLRDEIAAHGKVKCAQVIPLIDSEIIKQGGKAVEGRLLLPLYTRGTVILVYLGTKHD